MAVRSSEMESAFLKKMSDSLKNSSFDTSGHEERVATWETNIKIADIFRALFWRISAGT